MKLLPILFLVFLSFSLNADLPIQNITVHCGTSENVNLVYHQAATDLGNLFGPSNTLYFGGAKVGLMGKVAEGAKSRGAKIFGVLAQILKQFQSALYQDMTSAWLPSLSERKQFFFGNTGAIIVLPGGIGTIDELMDLVAKKQLNEDDMYLKPLILVNINGFWDFFLQHLKHAVQEGFIDQKHLNLIAVVHSIQEIPRTLKNLLQKQTDPMQQFDSQDHWWEKKAQK